MHSMKITKSRNSKWLARASSLLALVGVSGVVASLFSPSRNHGVIDVVAVASASIAYTYLVVSMWLSKPPDWLIDWFGGREGLVNAERLSFVACCGSASVYLITIWFPIVYTLRRLDPHGPHIPTVPAAIVAAFGLGFLLLARLGRYFGGLGNARIVDTLTVVIYLAGTIQFLTAAKLLVNLTSLHGGYLLTVSAIGLAALTRYMMSGTPRRV